jgi:hypothetical protein
LTQLRKLPWTGAKPKIVDYDYLWWQEDKSRSTKIRNLKGKGGTSRNGSHMG